MRSKTKAEITKCVAILYLDGGRRVYLASEFSGAICGCRYRRNLCALGAAAVFGDCRLILMEGAP